MLKRRLRSAADQGHPGIEMLESRVLLASTPIVRISVSDALCAEKGRDIGEFTFRRTGSIDEPLTVRFQLSAPVAGGGGGGGGIAENGTDFIPLESELTIPAGRRTATLPIIPIDDLSVEGDETVVVTLLDGGDYDLDSNALARSGAITILDDDFLPRVTLHRPQRRATEIGESSGWFEVRRTGPTNLPLTVSLIVAGSARADVDYIGLPTSVTIRPGRARAAIEVRPFNDALFEGAETVRLTLVPDPARFTLATQRPLLVSSWIIIEDRPLVTLSVADPTGTAHSSDTASFLISRTGPIDQSLRVAFNLTGTAAPGTDYARIPGSITIAAGRSTALVVIRGRNTRFDTPMKTVTLTMRQLPSYNCEPGAANQTRTVQIVDDLIGPA